MTKCTTLKLNKISKSCALVCLMSVAVSSNSHAMLETSYVPTRSAADATVLQPNTGFTPRLGANTEGFLQPNRTKGQPVGYQVIEGSLDYFSSGQHIQSGVKVRGAVGVNDYAKYNYFYIPEMYMNSTAAVSSSRFSLGRKILPWSETDNQWQLGIWQPRFRWNYFEPETQGLTGFFVEKENSNHGFTIFASPIFLPEQGPGFSIEDGTVSSSSQYGLSPARTMDIMGQSSRVRYDVEMPNLARILLNPGAAAEVHLGGRRGLRTQVSYAYKPMNQILVGADGFLNLSGSNYDAIVTAHPRIVYHHLLGWEGGYYRDWMSTWVGVTREWSKNDVAPDSWTIQQTAPATLVSVGADFDTFTISSSPTRMGLSYLHRAGGDMGDKGPLANQNGPSLFESRYPYKDALAYSLKSPLPGKLGDTVSFHHRFIYELNNQSAAFLLKANYKLSKKFTIHAGGEMLSARPGTPSQGSNSDLISRYRANDRVFTGVNYVF